MFVKATYTYKIPIRGPNGRGNGREGRHTNQYRPWAHRLHTSTTVRIAPPLPCAHHAILRTSSNLLLFLLLLLLSLTGVSHMHSMAGGYLSRSMPLLFRQASIYLVPHYLTTSLLNVYRLCALYRTPYQLYIQLLAGFARLLTFFLSFTSLELLASVTYLHSTSLLCIWVFWPPWSAHSLSLYIL